MIFRGISDKGFRRLAQVAGGQESLFKIAIVLQYDEEIYNQPHNQEELNVEKVVQETFSGILSGPAQEETGDYEDMFNVVYKDLVDLSTLRKVYSFLEEKQGFIDFPGTLTYISGALAWDGDGSDFWWEDWPEDLFKR